MNSSKGFGKTENVSSILTLSLLVGELLALNVGVNIVKLPIPFGNLPYAISSFCG